MNAFAIILSVHSLITILSSGSATAEEKNKGTDSVVVKVNRLQHGNSSMDITATPDRVAYFGDLHLHTALSYDAYLANGARIMPEEAYRFARGEAISYFGQQVRRKWPLDFVAVTDHAENIGVLNELDDPQSAFSNSPLGRKLRAGGSESIRVGWQYFSSKDVPGADSKASLRSAWERVIEAANRHYEPGRFTTFIAYEWTSFLGGGNQHRNVIYRGDRAPLPFSALDSDKPENLWSYLEAHRKNGIEMLAIPHNPNWSKGGMYGWKDISGNPISKLYAERRMLNEPISEISQGKGQSETHPALSPSDEFANFEVYFDVGATVQNPGTVHGSYVREAYGRGMLLEARIGANPYKFGVVGSTDFHNALSTSDEDAFGGQHGGIDPMLPSRLSFLGRAVTTSNNFSFDDRRLASGALAGVWAESNTRESIYDALRRRETFATSGTRLKFRFFGGWNFPADLLRDPKWIRTAYAQGVAMGGDLAAKPEGAVAPQFVAWALKDPNSGNLDRLQIVKVWIKNGEIREKLCDVALSDGRKRDLKSGKVPLVGNTVDLKTATYDNSIGAVELSAVWRDPEFDPSVPAAYYLRVLEIPTPRWTTIRAVKAAVPMPRDVAATVQERGWSSAIWYAPAAPRGDHRMF